MYHLIWVRPDKQGFIEMGEYHTYKEAKEGIPFAESVLIEQCTDEEQKNVIRKGTWSIEKEEE